MKRILAAAAVAVVASVGFAASSSAAPAPAACGGQYRKWINSGETDVANMGEFVQLVGAKGVQYAVDFACNPF